MNLFQVLRGVTVTTARVMAIILTCIAAMSSIAYFTSRKPAAIADNDNITQVQAIQICKNAIELVALFPESVDFGDAAPKNDGPVAWWIDLDYSSTNSLGATIGARADCMMEKKPGLLQVVVRSKAGGAFGYKGSYRSDLSVRLKNAS